MDAADIDGIDLAQACLLRVRAESSEAASGQLRLAGWRTGTASNWYRRGRTGAGVRRSVDCEYW
jgi:hypothetical protein